MEDLKVPKQTIQALKTIKAESEKMHRKEFSYTSFNRKFRSFLKFSKLNDNNFGIRLIGFHWLRIKIERTNSGKYAIICIVGFPYECSFFIKTTKDLIQKILKYNLLVKSQLPSYR